MKLKTTIKDKSHITAHGRRNRRYLMVFLVSVGLAFFSTSLAVYFYVKYDDAQTKVEDIEQNGAATQKEIEDLVSAVGKLIELPVDEAPTVATVKDKEQLKDQDFFKNAENGDKVLAYIVAKKAILYRPSANKLIEVAPIYISDDEVTTNQ